jgi:DNA end-binding protein Ku
MWAGTLAFGLTDIPVRLGPATRPRELAFRQVHADDGGRITFRRTCDACGADVPYADVAKAYQRPDGGLVPLTDEELAGLEASRRIDVLGYTSPGAVDPLLVSRSYFLAPEPDGAHGYALFREALGQAARVAVATITLRQRAARAVIWPRGQALVLQTLLTPDEITDPSAGAVPLGGTITDTALAEVTTLITAMTRDFDPAGHRDTYRDHLEALVNQK